MLLLVGVFQKNAERVIGCFSALFIPEIGEREWLFIPFGQTTWPSRLR
jgi:hypothetical protein